MWCAMCVLLSAATAAMKWNVRSLDDSKYHCYWQHAANNKIVLSVVSSFIESIGPTRTGLRARESSIQFCAKYLRWCLRVVDEASNQFAFIRAVEIICRLHVYVFVSVYVVIPLLFGPQNGYANGTEPMSASVRNILTVESRINL